MFNCKFILNNQPMSELSVSQSGKIFSYPAFSGFGPHTNRRIECPFVELRTLLLSKPPQKLDGLKFAALGILEVA
mgnify:FL=1